MHHIIKKYLAISAYIWCIYSALFYVISAYLYFDAQGGMSHIAYNGGVYTHLDVTEPVSASDVNRWLDDRGLEGIVQNVMSDGWTRYLGATSLVNSQDATTTTPDRPPVVLFEESYYYHLGYRTGDDIYNQGTTYHVVDTLPNDHFSVTDGRFFYGYAPLLEGESVQGNVYINSTDETLQSEFREIFPAAKITRVERPPWIHELRDWFGFNNQILILLLCIGYSMIIVFLSIAQGLRRTVSESRVRILLGESPKDTSKNVTYRFLFQHLIGLVLASLLFRIYAEAFLLPLDPFTSKGFIAIAILFLIFTGLFIVLKMMIHDCPIKRALRKGA